MNWQTRRSTSVIKMPAASLSAMNRRHRRVRFNFATTTILIALSIGAHRVNCGSFDLGNAGAADRIPREWEQKLDALNLQDLMGHSVRMAKREYDMSLRLEEYVLSTGIRISNASSSYALLLDNLPSQQVKELDREGHLMLKLSSQLVYSSCITNGIPYNHCAHYISRLDIPSNASVARECSAINRRPKDAPGHPYRRLLPADYSDGLDKLRRTKHNNHPLPSPRSISIKLYEAALEKANEVMESALYSPEGQLDRSRSVFLVQWSQFVEQDLVNTVQRRHDNDQPVECCKNNKLAAPRSLSSSCSPIHVSDNDPFYSQFFLNCLNYVRSAITVNSDCKLGAINQLNMASDHLDLSQVYGTTSEITNKLRLHSNGKLKTDPKHLLTVSTSHDNHCLPGNSSCLESGDSRVNYSPYMILQHAIFHQSHNKIADQLKEINPQWRDEKLFQTARKINRAIFQQVTYDEWLPMVVGHRQAIRIRTNNEGSTTIRGVSNEFATAAIRFYSSMLPGDLFERPDKKLFQLRDTFYQPLALNWTKEERGKLIAGTLTQKAMALDTSYVDDLNVDLFRAKNGDGDHGHQLFGTDSLALDIMRSRDHGLTGYVHYLAACRKADNGHETSSENHTWQELAPLFNPKDFEVLRKIYRHVEDIDLIVGAMAELPEGDSLVGPTFSCIIGEQMDKSKRSDPNFYSSHFRLQETVQNYSAAKLLCDTMDVKSVQADVFQIPSQHGRNPIVSCDELSNGLNLNLWKETE